MNKKITGFLFLEVLIAFLISLDYLPQEFSFAFLLVFCLGILVLSSLESILLFILSIPFFVVFPPNAFSDAMSVWRAAVFMLFAKATFSDDNFMSFVKDFKKKGIKGFSGIRKKIVKSSREIKKANYYDVMVAFAIFLLIALLSLVSAVSVAAGIKKIIFILSIVTLFPTIMIVAKNKSDLEKIVRAVFSSLLVILFFGYAQFISTFFIRLYDFWGLWDNYVVRALYGERTSMLLSWSNTWFSYYEGTDLPPTLRMFSLMPDSHSFSMLMIMLFAVSLFYLRSASDDKNRKKIFIVLILSLMAIFFSGSRGAWAGWLGALVVAGGLYYSSKIFKKSRFWNNKNFLEEKKNHRFLLVIVLIFVLVLPVSSFFLNLNQDVQIVRDGLVVENRGNALLRRTKSIYDFDETSNKGRLEIWKDSVVSISERPLSGVGYGNFSVAIGENVSTSKLGSSAHNIYLDVAVETGILGLIFFLLIFWNITKKLFYLSYELKTEKWRFFAGAFLVSFAWLSAYGFFDVVLLNDRVLMVFVILIAAFYRYERIENKSGN